MPVDIAEGGLIFISGWSLGLPFNQADVGRLIKINNAAKSVVVLSVSFLITSFQW